jgi:hypothetical protein
MTRKRQVWSIGDVFAIPLEDGTFGVGQIIGYEPQALNSAAIALFDLKLSKIGDDPPDVDAAGIFAMLFSTRELLDSGVWRVLGQKPVPVPDRDHPYERLRSKGFIGAAIEGAGIVRRFVNAYFGLAPWNPYKDPEYFDKLLIEPAKRPTVRLVFQERGAGEL